MDGIIPLWKEKQMTSHDCVRAVRKLLKTKKVGHSGTLDPDVDGVLPICIGKGTKLVEYLQESSKVYAGEITLGFSTTTEDASGEIVSEKTVSAPISTEMIDQTMQQFLGEIVQIPPMYSAVKVNGKRLYEYARAGETVERPKRKALIKSFIRTTEPVWDQEKGTLSWRFQVECGKGTYVRTLAVDLGKALGYPAHMSQLTRLASGGFSKDQALTLAEIEAAISQADFSFLLPIEEGVKQFTRIDLDQALYQKVKNGVFLPSKLIENQAATDIIALFYQDKVVSLYGVHPTKPQFLKPIKVLRNEQ